MRNHPGQVQKKAPGKGGSLKSATMRKLLLINPMGRRSGMLLSRVSTLPPLSLAYVAAVTPPSWEVVIQDENFTPLTWEEADLVGITAFTSNINRAYEIAEAYRKRKIKVIMGGIHVSMVPEEALSYADSVVVGEVENIWKTVIEDFEQNRLQPKYLGPLVDLARSSVRPRRDLIHPGYLWSSLQTSRGCPFHCRFCSVSKYLGKEYRQRPAEAVLKELEEIEGEYLFFLDDNLIGYSPESRQRAKKIFEGMIQRGLKKKWWMKTSINAAEDEELLELASRAGCMFAFVGFETTDPETLKAMRKGINLKMGIDNYRRVVDTFHRHRIGVYGAFILGNDYETPEYYRRLAEFLPRSGIDIFQISILTPLPGTQLMEQLGQEGRLLYTDFPRDWAKYRFSYVVHQPQGLTEETIYRADSFLKKKIYSFPWYPARLAKSFFHLKSLHNFYVMRKLNQAGKRSWQNAHYYSKYPHYL